MFFDSIIFLYALYVAFAYAVLAFGATYFSEIADRQKLVHMEIGETLVYAINASSYLLIGSILMIFIIFAFIASLLSTPGVISYVFPLAMLINALQLLLRASYQKVAISTRGVQFRYLFRDGRYRLRYDTLRSVHIESLFSYYKVSFFSDVEKIAEHCYINQEQLHVLLKQIRNYPDCEIKDPNQLLSGI